MSEDNLSGILVDPLGPGLALSKSEHACLKVCLEMLRYDGRTPWSNELSWLCHLFRDDKGINQPSGPDELTAAQMMSLVTKHGSDEFDSILGPKRSERTGRFEIERLSNTETETLQNTLAAIRIGGWFADWIDLQVACIAKAKLPGDRHPSPLTIAGTLTTAINEWEERVEWAQHFAELRPDLIAHAVAAAPEPTPTRKPRRAPATRKRGRKAA